MVVGVVAVRCRCNPPYYYIVCALVLDVYYSEYYISGLGRTQYVCDCYFLVQQGKGDLCKQGASSSEKDIPRGRLPLWQQQGDVPETGRRSRLGGTKPHTPFGQNQPAQTFTLTFLSLLAHATSASSSSRDTSMRDDSIGSTNRKKKSELRCTIDVGRASFVFVNFSVLGTQMSNTQHLWHTTK